MRATRTTINTVPNAGASLSATALFSVSAGPLKIGSEIVGGDLMGQPHQNSHHEPVLTGRLSLERSRAAVCSFLQQRIISCPAKSPLLRGTRECNEACRRRVVRVFSVFLKGNFGNHRRFDPSSGHHHRLHVQRCKGTGPVPNHHHLYTPLQIPATGPILYAAA
jgi:hypothetical protein